MAEGPSEMSEISSSPDDPVIRILLMGRNGSGKSSSGNTILGEKKFKVHIQQKKQIDEDESSVVCDAVTQIGEKQVQVIDCPDLLNPDMNKEQLEMMKEQLISRCSAGLSAVLLVVPIVRNVENEEEMLDFIRRLFVPEVQKYIMILFSDGDELEDLDQTIEEHLQKKDYLQRLVTECGGKFHCFNNRRESDSQKQELLQKIEGMMMENRGKFIMERMRSDSMHVPSVFLEIIPDVVRTDNSMEHPLQNCRRPHHHLERKGDQPLLESNEKMVEENRNLKLRTPEELTPVFQTTNNPSLGLRSSFRIWTRKINRSQMSLNFSRKQKLNLVLCGCDSTLKVSVSKLLRGKKIKPSHQRAISEECVKREERIHGRLISLVELPALTQLSEEEVMRQTLKCVSLCDPGVHVFLLIAPPGPLNNDERAEIEKIQNIFYFRDHFMVLFTTELIIIKKVTNFVESSPEFQKLISRCGGQYRLMGLNEPKNSRQIPDLLDYIENMKTEPYSLQMYVKARENRVRHELEEQHKRDMENKIKELQGTVQSEGAGEADDLESLRIVLIGRTGNGKSATGNTILGRNEFHSRMSTDSVTTACEKRIGEVDGRSVAVVDTPGLFDTTLSNDRLVEEIVKCFSLSLPGPHVFVIVLSLGRFTKEKMDTMDLIKKIFGPKAAQFSIVLFTRGDELENESIEDYVKRSNSVELQKLIKDCGNRFLVFNNREKQDKTQVIQLLNMIEEMKNANQGRYFTNSMFEEAEMSIKKKMEEIMQEKEKEIQVQKDELQAKYEREMKNMMKILEEKKQRADKQRMKMQNQLREKEKKIRKEFEEKEKTEEKKQETENQKRSEEEKQQRAEFLREIEEMKRRELQKHEKEIKDMMKKHQDEARKQAEEFHKSTERKLQHVLELTEMLKEHQKQHKALGKLGK